jgi:hypothetical protein
MTEAELVRNTCKELRLRMLEISWQFPARRIVRARSDQLPKKSPMKMRAEQITINRSPKVWRKT